VALIVARFAPNGLVGLAAPHLPGRPKPGKPAPVAAG
jgi:hypothetical protein